MNIIIVLSAMATTSGSSAEPHRTSAYSNDLRWRMVYQEELLGLTCREVGENLNVDASTVSRVVSRFYQTGDVDEHAKSGRPTTLTAYDEFVILENILTRPSTSLREIVHDMKQVTGTEVNEATVCRFLKKNNFSRKKLQQVALQRSAELRSEFLSDCSVYNPEMLVFLDETGCDRRNSLRKSGYSLVGKRAPSTSLLVRGVRYSAIGFSLLKEFKTAT